MDENTYTHIFYYSIAATFIPTIALLLKFNRQPIEYKWLAMMLLFSFLCDFMNEVQYQYFRLPVNLIGNFYVVVDPILLCGFFYHALKWKSLKLPIIIVCTIYLLLSIVNFAFVQKININTHSYIVEKLLTMLLSIGYFYRVIKELPAEKIYHIGLFWIISSMFTFSSA